VTIQASINSQLTMTAPEVTICPGYLSPSAATELYAQLRDRIEWDDRISARKTACFGLPYNYSGLTYDLQPMHSLLVPICDRLKQTLGFMPNSCLINYYEDGRAKMGFHSDEIDNLEAGTQIIIISLGAERKLAFRSTTDYDRRLAYLLPHGSLMYMSLQTQKFWSHAIKRTKDLEGRISLTFRRITPSDPNLLTS
jgi:alkylated DNA repair dioxygenase AlkB